jgi:hypothetical protein
MAIGRGERSVPESYFVGQGYYGRIAPPPEGDIFVRDPAAARAEAIRAKVALFKRHGEPVPEHLQMLFDTLPKQREGDKAVDLVDAVSGEHVGGVSLEFAGEVAPNPEVNPEANPEVEPEPVEAEPEGSGGAGALAVEAQAVPKPGPRRGRPRKETTEGE